MWNLKRLSSNVLLRVNSVLEENVKMASKKAIIEEKPPKPPKRGLFRRSESVTPDHLKNASSDVSNTDTKSNESESKKVIRRSSMICSEGFDKYTFDCHRRNAPHRTTGLESDTFATPQEAVQNQNSPVSENDMYLNARTSKSVTNEQSVVRKISIPFKPLAAISTSNKNAPQTFKRVPEETIPDNVPLTYKRVPEETIPMAKNTPINSISNKSPLTAIPLSFNPVPEESNWNSNRSAFKSSPIKSAPVKNSPFSFKQVSQESSPVRKEPHFPFRPASEESAPPKNIPPSSLKQVSPESAPVRNAPLSFKNIPEKSRPVNKALSFRSVTDHSSPVRNIPLSLKNVSEDFNPSRSAPLSLKRGSVQSVSNNYVSDEPMHVRNSPLSLKFGESVSLRNIPSSLHFADEPSIKTRNIPLSLQSVPEEPTPVKDSSASYKNVPDEPIPFRNAPLSLKPILTKHISLLKKKTSFKGPIIKRDSVVHPGRIDMQGSLFIDGRFQNPWPTWKPPTFTNVLKFGITRNKSKVPPKQELDLILPIVRQNFSKLSIPEDGIRVTWIGHSTVLIQMHGLNILTDPMFSDRASPSQVVGPKRYRDPPCSIHDLPHINAVVISHSHYDHLDHNTVTLLNARFGSDIRWFVPLGLQVWMEQVGCENVVELDWWEENCVPEHSDIFFVFTPAQHWSKRTLGDDNKVLWGSWCILGPKYKFFFAGDTGYCEVFKQIGRVHGPFDLSAIPIGAYEPRWFMKYQHVNPEEAVKIHMDVKSKKSLAIHWGTFSLANEYYLDPPVRLRESLDKYEIPPELFFTLKHGDSRLIAQNNLVKKYPLSERNMNNS